MSMVSRMCSKVLHWLRETVGRLMCLFFLVLILGGEAHAVETLYRPRTSRRSGWRFQVTRISGLSLRLWCVFVLATPLASWPARTFPPSSFVRTETGVNDSPTLIKRGLSTVVTVQDDEIILLGGLEEEQAEESRDGLFFLPDWLKGNRRDTGNTEIILLLHVRRI
jgi:hypothetical protein